MKKNCKEKNPRLGTVGGQAVLEGIMMKGGDDYALAVRQEDGGVKVSRKKFVSVRKKNKFFRLPIIRGIVAFVESMVLSYKTLNESAAALGIEDVEPETKFEKWIMNKFGKHLLDVIMVISSVLGIALGVGLFFFLPMLITKGFDRIAGGNLGWFKNLIEGLVKIGLFLGYLALVSLMKDIRRTFEYHGAEHKSIFCYESGEELTVENVKKYKRFHPRCGTSFIFVMLAISILIYSLPFITWDNMALRMLTKLLMLPIIVGLGFEFIIFAGKHENIFTRILSAPGLWIQRLTTKEPDDSQIEVAIIALKTALPDVFPDYKYENPKKAEEGGDVEALPDNPEPDETSDMAAVDVKADSAPNTDMPKDDTDSE